MKENKKDFTYRLIFYLSEIPIALLGHFIFKGNSHTPPLSLLVVVVFIILGCLWVIRDLLFKGKFKFLAHLIGVVINIGLLYFIIP